jgi:hypothetical protein
MTQTRNRGARPIQLPDWPFGAPGRRLLLDALLRDDPPDGGWQVKQLEAKVRVSNNGLVKLLPGAIDLGLAEVRDGRIWPTDGGDLASALSAVLAAVANLPPRPPRPLPKRPYGRS